MKGGEGEKGSCVAATQISLACNAGKGRSWEGHVGGGEGEGEGGSVHLIGRIDEEGYDQMTYIHSFGRHQPETIA